MLRYERNVTAILGLLPALQSQIYDLKRAYCSMEENLNELGLFYESDEDLALVGEAFQELAILFGCNQNQGIRMLNCLGELVDGHFMH